MKRLALVAAVLVAACSCGLTALVNIFHPGRMARRVRMP